MKFKINHKSHVALHLQAEELLRKILEDPQYNDGKLLPNEVDLAKQLAISRSTLRQAIGKLVFEGLLIRKKGVGTKKAQHPVSTKSTNWVSFTQEMESRGIPVKNFELHISWVLPEQYIADFLHISTDQKILKMIRLRGDTEGPFVYFISYFHPEIGLTGDEDFKRQLYEILESDYGIRVELSKEEINAIAADKLIAAKLEIEPGTPVFFRKRFVYDQEDRPIEYNVGYYRADRFTYTVESRRAY